MRWFITKPMPTPCSMVTTAKSDRPRPAPNHSSAKATRLASLSMVTGTPMRAVAAAASGMLRTCRTEDQCTSPSATSTKPGTPMPMPESACGVTPALAQTRAKRVSTEARRSSSVIGPGWRGTASSATRLPAKSTITAVCSRSDSFIPATRCAAARTPKATAGRPRADSTSRGAATSSIRPASINSAQIVVTEAGETSNSRASVTRGIRPAARIRSKIC